MAWLAGGTGGRRISWGNCRWCDFILFYENQAADQWCGFCKKSKYPTPAPLKVPDVTETETDA